MAEEDRGLTSHIGPVEIDWPRSLGYFGGIGLATALGLMEPPVAIFIAAIPFFKMLNRPNAPLPARFVAQVLDGASKPVGGDSDATIQLTTKNVPVPRPPRPSISQEARQLAQRRRTQKISKQGELASSNSGTAE